MVKSFLETCFVFISVRIPETCEFVYAEQGPLSKPVEIGTENEDSRVVCLDPRNNVKLYRKKAMVLKLFTRNNSYVVVCLDHGNNAKCYRKKGMMTLFRERIYSLLH